MSDGRHSFYLTSIHIIPFTRTSDYFLKASDLKCLYARTFQPLFHIVIYIAYNGVLAMLT